MKKIKINKNNKGTKRTQKVKTENEQLWKKVLSYVLLFAIIVISIGLAFMIYIVITSPDFEKSKLYQKEPTVLYDKNGNEFARVGSFNSTLLTYDEIPDVLVDALVATEDSRFFQHNGIDLVRFLKASLLQAIGKNDAGGASTLSMQLMKRNYNGNEASGIEGIVRKFKDIYMAVFKLEANYTKEEIIEFYFNSQWFANAGNINIADGIYGVEEASLYFFGKSAKDINLAEATLLVGMFQNPAWYNLYTNPEGCRLRQKTVLNLMVRHGYITEEQRDEVLNIPVSSLLVDKNKETLKVESYQAFVDYTLSEVQNKLGINPSQVALKIYTTYDPEVQNVLERVEKGEIYKFPSQIIQEGIAVTSSTDGSIVAMSGGRNYLAKGTNHATTRHQPGSTAKPLFDYSMYIEHISQSSYAMIADTPTKYSTGQSISNYDNSHKGIITMRYALSDSRNVPALKVFKAVAALDQKIIEDFVHSVGIDYGDTLYEAASIGGFNGASPLEMSAAYGTFARGGYYIEPYSYTKVVNTETDKEYTQSYTKTKVMEESTAFMISDILDDVFKSDVSGTTVAGKTGTTNLNRDTKKQYGLSNSAISDSWYITFSPSYSIAFWYGYDSLNDAKKDHEETGFSFTSSTGGTARTNIMRGLGKIHKKNEKFKQPKNVVTADVELQSFPPQLCSAYTPASLCTTEYFVEGTEPTDISKRFNTLDNPTNGSYSYSGNTITLNWDPIATPDHINNTYLQNLFNEHCGSDAEKYYTDRVDYNNKNIGSINYIIYLRDASGKETRIGSTNSNTFNYIVSSGGEYTFVVKAAYTIFNANASSGLIINAKTIDSTVNNMIGGNNNNNANNGGDLN